MQMRVLGALLLLLAVAACAPIARSPAPATSASPAANLPSGGTILSMRPVAISSQQIASIGNAIGASLGGPDAGRGSTEIIVRTNDGNVISVVQTDAAELHPGDRVNILRDGGLHLVRAGS